MFAVLQAGPRHVIALQNTHHATHADAAQWCREGGRPHRPMGWPTIYLVFVCFFLGYRGIVHHFRLLAHQQAAAWPYCSRLALFCQGAQPVLQTPVADVLPLKAAFFFFFFFCWATGELSTLRQMMKVPNEPGLCPNTGLENTS